MKARASQPSRAALERQVADLEAKNRELARTLQIIEEARTYLADQYDFSPVGFVTLDGKGCMRDVNLTAARLLGRERAQLLTMPFLTCIAKPGSHLFLHHLRQCGMNEGEVVSQLEMRIGHRKTLQVELRSVPVIDPRRGDTVYRTTIIDITDRIRAIKALRESEKRYQIVDSSPDGIFILIGESIVFANRAALALCGVDKVSEVIGRKIIDYVLPAFRQQAFAELLASGEPGGLMEIKLAGPDDGRRDVEIATSGFAYEGDRAVLIVARDISLRRKAERQVLAISEREKAHFGQDLHDGLCQTLSGAACLAEVLRHRLLKDYAPAAPEAAEIATLVRRCIEEAYGLAKGLHPVAVEKHGLVAALQKLAEDVSRRSGIQCQVQCPDNFVIHDPGVATNLYRIAQEAMANAIKHATPASVLVRLRENRGRTVLSISDDGIGIPEKPRGSGMGLYTMRYRATMIGGSVDIRRGEARGTVVTCSFPTEVGRDGRDGVTG